MEEKHKMNRFVHRILKSSTAASVTSISRSPINSINSIHARNAAPALANAAGAASTNVVNANAPTCPVNHASPSVPSVQALVQQLQNSKLVYFGEFHSEPRIIAFQTELVKEWSRCLARGAREAREARGSNHPSGTRGARGSNHRDRRGPRCPRLHVIMEHFSVDMQPLLDRYQNQSYQGNQSPYGSSASMENDNNDNSDNNDKGNEGDGDDEAFQQLLHSYKHEYGTEGHDLNPYREFLQFCRQTTSTATTTTTTTTNTKLDKENKTNETNETEETEETDYCEVILHGGFIPRTHAARLNKECPDENSKRVFFEEMSCQRGYLPKRGEAMHRALFEDGGRVAEGREQGRQPLQQSYKLKGSPEHELLIQSLMNGADLYSPPDDDEHDERDEHDNEEGEDGEKGAEDAQEKANEETEEEESPLARLYQAQLLKDHAMGYKIATLMLDHCTANTTNESNDVNDMSNTSDMSNISTDRYLIIAGFGHLKHYCGVPAALSSYLRAEALHHPDDRRRGVALDLLLRISCEPTPKSIHMGGKGAVMIGCQMMYEAYLEDHYPPLVKAISDIRSGSATRSIKSAEDHDRDHDDDDDMDEEAIDALKQRTMQQLYLQNPTALDYYILKSQEVHGPFLRYADGIAGFERPCADYLFVYDEDDDHVIEEGDFEKYGVGLKDDGESMGECPMQHMHHMHHMQQEKSNNDADNDAKLETMQAYEQVGKTAAIKGNVARARAIMTQIGYEEEDLEYLGEGDIYNFQGVANPHKVAKIQLGETVLDIGSGLGIDSFLAMRNCGADNYNQYNNYNNYNQYNKYNNQKGLDSSDNPNTSNTSNASNNATTNSSGGPFVVGVDLAKSEVHHATQRAIARGYDVPHRIQFLRGDVERLNEALDKANAPQGLVSSHFGLDGFDGFDGFDVCISNGAFCLVPDKRTAFQNVYRALRPGGRMAISTTTLVSDRLDPSFEWPVCMQMFASLESLKPMCESIGFRNVEVVDAESPMEGMEIPEEEGEDNEENEEREEKRKRFKIHGRYADQFAFLENLDMDKLCKVVTVYGEKIE